LFIADGTQLPFPDESFDVVLSFGVIEHLGEGIAASRKGQDPYKERYIHEVARVLKPKGRALIGAPNGAFPIDFWHTTRHGVRFHRPYEHWMPNSFAMRRWAGDSPIPLSIRFMPPGGYFAFQRVRQHWYGRVFGRAMQTALSAIDRRPKLSASALNPILVAELCRL
jgi:SAM-dependent methyltransferase